VVHKWRAQIKYGMGSLEQVIALRCLCLVEDHNPLSMVFGEPLANSDRFYVHCTVCGVTMDQWHVIAHIKGTGSPWWVTPHRRRRHETMDVPPDAISAEQHTLLPEENYEQGFRRYVANWYTPSHIIVLEDITNDTVESRRLYCQVCRAVLMNHSMDQKTLMQTHMTGAVHAFCESHNQSSIDWLAECHHMHTQTPHVTPTQKKIISKVQRNLRVRVKSKDALALPVHILCGAPMEFIIQHLQQRFQNGMSWANYGSWHIDHVLPVSAFNTSDALHCLVMCHYTNLQPLWGHQNLAKGSNVD